MLNLVHLAKTELLITQSLLDGTDKIINYGEVVAKYFGLKFSDLQQNTRRREIVYPRQILYYLLAQSGSYTLSEIGHAIGKRDHATVTYSRKVIRTFLEYDLETQFHVNRIKTTIGI